MNCKSIIIATSLIISSWSAAMAQEEQPDTILILNNPASVSVQFRDGVKIITLTPDIPTEAEPANDYPGASFFNLGNQRHWSVSNLFSDKKKTKSRSYTSTNGLQGLYAGGLISTDGDPAIKNGWEIGISNIIQGRWSAGRGKPMAMIGLGLGWQRINVGNGLILSADHGILSLTSLPEGCHDLKSKIKTFHFTVPLAVVLPFSQSIGLTLGGELHLNTYTTATASWTNENSKHIKKSMKGLHQRMATIELKGSLGWTNGVAVYASYSPMKKWKAGYGPEYKTIAIGATVAF